MGLASLRPRGVRGDVRLLDQVLRVLDAWNHPALDVVDEVRGSHDRVEEVLVSIHRLFDPLRGRLPGFHPLPSGIPRGDLHCIRMPRSELVAGTDAGPTGPLRPGGS